MKKNRYAKHQELHIKRIKQNNQKELEKLKISQAELAADVKLKKKINKAQEYLRKTDIQDLKQYYKKQYGGQVHQAATISMVLNKESRGLFGMLTHQLGRDKIKEMFDNLILSGKYPSYQAILDKVYELMGYDVYEFLYNPSAQIEQRMREDSFFASLNKEDQINILKQENIGTYNDKTSLQVLLEQLKI